MLTVVGIEGKTGVSTLVHKAVRSLSKLVSRTYVQTCEKCLLTINENIVVHKLCFCSGATDERSNVWSLYQQYFGFKALRELLGLTPSAHSKQIVNMALNLTDNLELSNARLSRAVCNVI